MPRSKEYARSKAANLPRSLLIALMIPVTVVGYSFFSMHLKPSFTGIVDHTLFVLIWYVLFDLLLTIPFDAVRVASTFVFTIAMSIFFLSNTLYYEFFRTWGTLDTMKQWNDIPALWKGILMLSSPLDFVFYFLLPVLLWQFSMRYSIAWKPSVKIAFAAWIFALMFGQKELAAGSMSYLDNNPFLYMVRNKTLSLSLAHSKECAVTKQLAQYQPINATLYSHSADDRFPFLKKALPYSKPLPFALKNQPNVILILVESWRAFELGAYGSKPSFSPNFDRRVKEGIFFPKFYAVANQTIRAEFALLSSYNADALGGPVYVNNLNLSVLNLPMVLRGQGYETHWFEADCGSYVQRKINFLESRGVQNFHKVKPIGPPLGWGASDEETFNSAFETLSESKKPFFAEIMTLSNHWMWDCPYPTAGRTPHVEGSDIYQHYTQGIYYSDYAIETFLRKLEKSPLANNTIVIITGDHGVHYFPEKVPESNVLWHREIEYRLPLLIWSPKLIKPMRVNRLGNHLDVAPTVLDLLNVHVDTSFMGTSLFRDDVQERYVFMIQDGRWNLRKENSYLFDAGPEVFMNTPPFNLKGHMQLVHGRNLERAGFETEKDLLQQWPTDGITVMEPNEQVKMAQWAERANMAYHSVIFKNQIYPAPAARPSK